MSKIIRWCLVLCALTIFQNQSLAQENLSPKIKHLDSLSGLGNFQEALDGFKTIILELENKNQTTTVEYVHSIRQALYCQIRLPSFKKAEDIVNKVIPKLKTFKDLPKLELASLNLSIGESFYLVSGDYDRALTYTRRGYNMLKKANVKNGKVADAATYLGVIYANKPHYDSSQYYLNEALKEHISMRGRNHFLVAGVYSQIALSQSQNGDFWKGLSAAKQMLTITTWEVDSTLIDESLYTGTDSLGLFFQDFINLAREKDILSQFHPLDTEIGRVILNSFYTLGELKKAEELATVFLDVYTMNKNQYLVADVQTILGNIYMARNQYEYAHSLYLQAKNTYLKLDLDESLSIVWVYQNLGQIHNEMNNLDSAVYYNQKALRIREKIYKQAHPNTASSFVNLASDYEKLGDHDSVLFYLNKSLEFDFQDPSNSYFQKGKTFVILKQLDSAKTSFRTSLDYSKSSQSPFYARSLLALGEIFLDANQSDSAYSFFQKAAFAGYPTLKEALAGHSDLDVDLVNHPASFLHSLSMNITYHLRQFDETHDKKELHEALKYCQLSEQLISQVRSGFIMDGDHLRFSGGISSIIKNTVEVNLALFEESGNKGFLMEAFRIADLNKSQLLLEALKSSMREQQNNNSILSEWTALRNQLRSQRVKVREMALDQTESPEKLIENKNHLTRLENKYARLLKSIKQTQPSLFYYVSDNSRDFSVESFQKYLRNTESIAVQYFLSEDHLYQFWLSGRDISYYKKELKDDKLINASNEFYKFVSTPPTSSSKGYSEYLSNGHFLYTNLLPFLETNPNTKQVIIIPDGFLSSIPFEALLTESVEPKETGFSELPYLIKKRPVSYAFSASVLSETLRNDNENNNLIATGWAPFSDELNLDEPQKNILRNKNLSKLVGASLEIQGIEKRFNGENFISKRASEAIFREKAVNSKIMHIATHGIVNEESPELSYLVFNKDEEDSLNDGDLHLFELYDIPLKADLTILSACNTGTGKLAVGEGVLSMARAFTYSGSKSVMMSLWLANDKSTYQLIDNFYLKLANFETKSRALQKSKLTYLASADNIMSHPFFWAHIITTGNDEALVKRPFNPVWLLLLILLIVMITIKVRRQKIIKSP